MREDRSMIGSGHVRPSVLPAPARWQDEAEALDLADALQRFPQWTYLPILPNREETLRDCIRDGVSTGLWAIAIGDAAHDRSNALGQHRPFRAGRRSHLAALAGCTSSSAPSTRPRGARPTT